MSDALVDALRPFAEMADCFDRFVQDSHITWSASKVDAQSNPTGEIVRITLGDCREAQRQVYLADSGEELDNGPLPLSELETFLNNTGDTTSEIVEEVDEDVQAVGGFIADTLSGE